MATTQDKATHIARNYHRYLVPFLFEPFAKELVSGNQNSSPSSILELACGTGILTRHIRKAFPSSGLIASDLHPEMLEVAKENLKDETIHWQLVDARELPYLDEQFDLVFCQFGIMFIAEKLKAAVEIHRVLKPGGQFIFNTWDKIENNGAIYEANTMISSYFPEKTPAFFQLPFSYNDPGEIELMLKGAGFRNSTIDLIKKEGLSPSAEDAAKGMVEGNPVYKHIMEKDPFLVDKIRSAVEKKMSENFGNNPLKTPLQAWQVQALK